jgi:hypothetical protein
MHSDLEPGTIIVSSANSSAPCWWLIMDDDDSWRNSVLVYGPRPFGFDNPYTFWDSVGTDGRIVPIDELPDEVCAAVAKYRLTGETS